MRASRCDARIRRNRLRRGIGPVRSRTRCNSHHFVWCHKSEPLGSSNRSTWCTRRQFSADTQRKARSTQPGEQRGASGKIVSRRATYSTGGRLQRRRCILARRQHDSAKRDDPLTDTLDAILVRSKDAEGRHWFYASTPLRIDHRSIKNTSLWLAGHKTKPRRGRTTRCPDIPEVGQGYIGA